MECDDAAAKEAARYILLSGGPALLDARPTDSNPTDAAAPQLPSDAAAETEVEEGRPPPAIDRRPSDPAGTPSHDALADVPATATSTSGVAVVSGRPTKDRATAVTIHSSAVLAPVLAGVTGPEALLGGSELLCQWLVSTGKTIITGMAGGGGDGDGGAAAHAHYTYLATCTTSVAIDRVVQSLRYATSRRVIIRALLRSAARVIADLLLTAERRAAGASCGAGGGAVESGGGDDGGMERDDVGSGALASRYFPDTEDRTVDEAMLHAAIVAFVNVDAVELHAQLEEDAVADYCWLVRWIAMLATTKRYVSLPSLGVAICCLLYGGGLGPVNWRTAQELRRLVDGYRMTYSGYDDAVSTMNELHSSFLGACYQLCRNAINDILPRIQRNLQSVSAKAKAATLLHRAMVDVRTTFELFIEKVEECFHQLVRAEERIRQSVLEEYDAGVVMWQDMFVQHKEIAIFHQAWSLFFTVLGDEEAELRRTLDKEMRCDSDYLEVAIADFIRCPHSVIHEAIWDDVLWDLQGIDQREDAIRRTVLTKDEAKGRAALQTAMAIDRQSIALANTFDDYYLEGAETRSATRLAVEAQQRRTVSSSRPATTTELPQQQQQQQKAPSAGDAIVVPMRPVSPPAAAAGATTGTTSRSSSSRAAVVASSHSLSSAPSRKLQPDLAAPLSDDEQIDREMLVMDEERLRANFLAFVQSAFVHRTFDWSLGGSSALGFSRLPLVTTHDFMSNASGVGKLPDRHLPAFMRTPQPSLPRISSPRTAVSPTGPSLSRNTRRWSPNGGAQIVSLRAESRGVGLLLPQPLTVAAATGGVGATFPQQPNAHPIPQQSQMGGRSTCFTRSPQPSMVVDPLPSASPALLAGNPRPLQQQSSSSAGYGWGLDVQNAAAGGLALSPQPPAPQRRVLSALEDDFFGARSRRTAKYGKGGALLPTMPCKATGELQ